MPDDHAFLKETEALREMRALEAIGRDPSVSQRELAHSLGVAVGVANACVRTLVRKGLVKIRGDNNRTLTYHLTKQGVLHKSRLALEWTRNTVDFYRQARREVASRLVALSGAGVGRVLLYGSHDVVEIAAIVAPETGLDAVGIVLSLPAGADTVGGLPVLDLSLAVSVPVDTIVLCEEVSAEERETLAVALPSVSLVPLFGALAEEAGTDGKELSHGRG